MDKIKAFKELIEIGTKIESIDEAASRYGYDRKQNTALKNRARKIIKDLKAIGIDPFESDYSFEDEDGNEWELEYSLQFI